MKTIELELRQVYGKDTIYPANTAAHTLTILAGKKTLDKKDLKLIQTLGFKLKFIENGARVLKQLG